MAGVGCLALLSSIWEPVGAALLRCLSSLWDGVAAEVRSRIFRWSNRVVEVAVSSADLVGREELFRRYVQQIGGYLREDTVGMIGICGMGGVGKTTLLKVINNDFLHGELEGFDVVIWVTVSVHASALEIQKAIGDRLGLSLSAERGPEEYAMRIFNVLCRRRFLLLLDDVWEMLDLMRVGVPYPTRENKCKIILTSRSTEVCRAMGADRLVMVNLLNASESWNLFRRTVGTEVDLDNPVINPLARDVVGKCGGLPLAITTVGRAMAGVVSAAEWERVLEQLGDSSHEVPGMQDSVLSVLKLSFDSLEDEATRSCLLYCCLFPEDEPIPVEELIEYWVGEGFLDTAQSRSITSARNRGFVVITRLISVCLLGDVEGESHTRSYVKMHDAVREMCLWLTRGEMLIEASSCHSSGVSRIATWGEAKRISLVGDASGGWPLGETWPRDASSFPNLQTLLCFGTHGASGNRCAIRPEFFCHTPALRVLDLGDTTIGDLPEEIGSLVELRYLNLGRTLITSLPRGLGRLANLRQLYLEGTYFLSHIPREAITTLSGLQALRIMYDFRLESEDPTDVGVPSSSSVPLSLEHMETCLLQLEELRIHVASISCLDTLLILDRLCTCTTHLDLDVPRSSGITTAHLSTMFRRLGNLRELRVRVEPQMPSETQEPEEVVAEFDDSSRPCRLEKLVLSFVYQINKIMGPPPTSPAVFGSLRALDLNYCDGIRDLSWARYERFLESISICNCPRIEELLLTADGLGGEDEEASLPKLRRLFIWNLPKLRSISRGALLLPSLAYLYVMDCPLLEKLPFGPDSAKNLRELRCQEQWWAVLQWDGPSMMARFLPLVQPWLE